MTNIHMVPLPFDHPFTITGLIGSMLCSQQQKTSHRGDIERTPSPKFAQKLHGRAISAFSVLQNSYLNRMKTSVADEPKKIHPESNSIHYRSIWSMRAWARLGRYFLAR